MSNVVYVCNKVVSYILSKIELVACLDFWPVWNTFSDYTVKTCYIYSIVKINGNP